MGDLQAFSQWLRAPSSQASSGPSCTCVVLNWLKLMHKCLQTSFLVSLAEAVNRAWQIFTRISCETHVSFRQWHVECWLRLGVNAMCAVQSDNVLQHLELRSNNPVLEER